MSKRRAAAAMRFHASSRSASLTPSTWSKRAMALRTCRHLLQMGPGKSIQRGDHLGHGGQPGLQALNFVLEAIGFPVVVLDFGPLLTLDGVDQLELEAADRVPYEVLVEGVHAQGVPARPVPAHNTRKGNTLCGRTSEPSAQTPRKERHVLCVVRR